MVKLQQKSYSLALISDILGDLPGAATTAAPAEAAGVVGPLVSGCWRHSLCSFILGLLPFSHFSYLGTQLAEETQKIQGVKGYHKGNWRETILDTRFQKRKTQNIGMLSSKNTQELESDPVVRITSQSLAEDSDQFPVPARGLSNSMYLQFYEI